MIKAIIFDYWSTLFYTDLSPPPLSVFAKKLGKDIHNREFMKDFERHFMLEEYSDLDTPIKSLLKELDISYTGGFVAELKQILESEYTHMKAYPETFEVLNRLKGKYKLGLMTNTNNIIFKNVNKSFMLQNLFGSIVTSYETGLIKPDPKMFKIILEKLDVNSEQAIMVGDTLEDDIVPAEDLGIKALLIDRIGKYPQYENKINSLEELTGRISSLQN
jgi:2-haloalkanoic acid dehalogenase type II